MLIQLVRHYFDLIYWRNKSINKVKDMQLQRFKFIFEYARSHSKFYRNLYSEAGVLDLDIKTWEDVQKIPIVNKAMMRKALTEDIMTCPFDEKKHNIHTTSGSSGNPFKVVYDKWVDYSGHLRFTWLMMRYGYTPFKKITFLSRFTEQTKFEVEEDLGIVKHLQNLFHMFRRDIISIFEKPEVIVDKLKEQNPFILWCTPSGGYLVALELERRKERLNIPLLVLMSETYTPEQLQLFRERICINVMDDYGCMELPTMGASYNQYDCKELIPNFMLAEVLNPRDLNGEKVGDFVVTNFLNKVMPFVRYNLGDYVGVLENLDFPNLRIGKVYGRIDDIIKIKDTYLSFHQVYQMYTDFILVDQYKLYQYKDGRLEFQMKLREGVLAEDAIKEAKRRWVDNYPNIEIDMVVKEEMKIDKISRKFKVVEKER